MIARGVRIATVVIAATCVAGTAELTYGQSAHASGNLGTVDSATVAPQANPNPKPKPKKPAPKGTLKLIKSGAEVKLTQDQASRQATRPPNRKPTSRHTGSPSDSIIRPSAQRKANVPFRLNIGICGHAGDSPGLTRCLPALDEPEEPVQPNRPEVTPSMVVAARIPRPEDVTWEQVLSEVKDVAFPQLSVKVQPAGRTLVNLDTIVYTDQSKVSTHTVTLLGFPVVVEAMPMSYTWNFGDGSSVTTTTPGRPYPAKDITHKYMKKGQVGLTLTTHYAARFNVAGTGWQYVEELVPITGPATALQVREAVPVLVEPGR